VFWVLGLGNPGPQYELTRHNAGFLALDTLAEKYRIPLDQHGYHALWGLGTVAGCPALLAKPLTFMNASGQAARALARERHLDPGLLIVVHDEIDLPLGRIKTKFGGGSAGHRGIASLIERLGTDRFHRVRIGVGKPEHKEDVADYLLSRFEDEEFPEVNRVLEEAVLRIEQKLKELNTQIQSHDTEEHSE